jgi:hypothetical protein
MDLVLPSLPDKARQTLALLATARGLSLEEYARDVLIDHCGRPATREWLERVRSLPRVESDLTGADWVRLAREDA